MPRYSASTETINKPNGWRIERRSWRQLFKRQTANC